MGNCENGSTERNRVEVNVDPKSREFSIKVYEGGELIEDFSNSKIVIRPIGYIEGWAKNKQKLKYWQGYLEFQNADQPNRQIIMAEASIIIP